MKNQTALWLKAALIRAVRTVAQSALATIGTTAAFDQVQWKTVAMVALLSGILSMLTSLAGLPEVDQQTVLYVPTDEQMENYHPPADEDGQDNQ